MARLSKGILGGINGKIGNVIGGSWKGIDYVRSKPSVVANPRTPAQTMNRNKFRSIAKFGSSLLGFIIQPFWNGKKAGMSGYNYFVSDNVDVVFPNGVIEYNQLKMARGSKNNVDDIAINLDSTLHTITVGWLDNSGIGNAVTSDIVNIVMYNINQDYFVSSIGSINRSSTSYIMYDPRLSLGDDCCIWIFCNENGNTKNASSSIAFSRTA